MAKLKFDITMSLDGFIAGPNPGPEAPLGEGGERLHQWVYGPRSFRERHGSGSGETNRDDGIAEEALANTGDNVYLRARGASSLRSSRPVQLQSAKMLRSPEVGASCTSTLTQGCRTSSRCQLRRCSPATAFGRSTSRVQIRSDCRS